MLFHCALICVVLAGLTDSGVAWKMGSGFILLKNDSLCPKNSAGTLPQLFLRDSHLYEGQACILKGTETMSTCNCGPRIKQERDDYILAPGIGWHKLHTRAATWNAARKICIEEGSDLAIINSVAEEKILMGMLSNRSGSVTGALYTWEAYVGIHDLFAEGDWVTVHGDSLAKTGYTGWSQQGSQQPDNKYGVEHCGTIMTEGGLNDVPCDLAFAFFCELPLIHVF